MRNTRIILSLAAASLLSVGTAAPAQDRVVGVADAEALFVDKDPKLHRNKQAAYHIVKELLETGHWEMADKWLTERYIQHNPLAASGRRGRRFLHQGPPRRAQADPRKDGDEGRLSRRAG